MFSSNEVDYLRQRLLEHFPLIANKGLYLPTGKQRDYQSLAFLDFAFSFFGCELELPRIAGGSMNIERN